MTYQFGWYDQERGIIQIIVDQPATWDDYHHVIELVAQEVERTPLDRLDVLFLNHASFAARDAVPHFRWTLKRLIRYHKLGLFVIVDASPQMRLIQVLVSSIMQVARVNFAKLGAIVPRPEDGLALIERDRRTRVKQQSPTVRPPSAV